MNTFNVSPKSIISALTLASKAIAKNPRVSITEEYLFEVKDNMLSISGSDLQTTLRVHIPISNVKQDVDVFSFVVPHTIIKYLQKVDSKEVTFEYVYKLDVGTDRQGKETTNHICKLLVTDNDGRANYACEYYMHYPKVPVCNSRELEVKTDLISEFKDLLNFVSDDDIRPAMTGIYFGVRENNVTLCATDAHRLKTIDVNDLVRYDIPLQTSNEGQLFILPAKPAKILSGLKLKESLQVSFKRTQKTDAATGEISHSEIENVMFSGTVDGMAFELITRAINERYPQFWNVIPQGEGTTKLTVNKKSFTKIIDKALLFAHKTTHKITISLNGENKISAEDLYFNNEFSGNIPDSVYIGD